MRIYQTFICPKILSHWAESFLYDQLSPLLTTVKISRKTLTEQVTKPGKGLRKGGVVCIISDATRVKDYELGQRPTRFRPHYSFILQITEHFLYARYSPRRFSMEQV